MSVLTPKNSITWNR